MSASSWPTTPGGSGVPPRPSYAPAQPAPTPMPGAIKRTRAELEELRNDAIAELAKDEHWGMPWLDPRHEGEGITGVLETAQWLLGEREIAPISQEWYAYPYTAREVGLERTRSEDRVFGYAWEDVPEWYGAGANLTLEWATGRTRGGNPVKRPISHG